MQDIGEETCQQEAQPPAKFLSMYACTQPKSELPIFRMKCLMAAYPIIQLIPPRKFIGRGRIPMLAFPASIMMGVLYFFWAFVFACQGIPNSCEWHSELFCESMRRMYVRIEEPFCLLGSLTKRRGGTTRLKVPTVLAHCEL